MLSISERRLLKGRGAWPALFPATTNSAIFTEAIVGADRAKMIGKRPSITGKLTQADNPQSRPIDSVSFPPAGQTCEPGICVAPTG